MTRATAFPSVDVIMPVYNGANHLHEAIESVLNQSYHPLQLIVVDDGSEDESAALAARFEGVCVLHGPHAGISTTLNRGIRHSRGDMIAFLDADDRWLPNKLALQVQYLQTHPEVDMVFGHTRQFYDAELSQERMPLVLTKQVAIHRGAVLMWRRAFEKVGEFTNSQQIADFVDWYARAIETNLSAHTLPDVVFERRIHLNNYGRHQRALEHHSYFQAIHSALTRRRDKTDG